MSRISDKLKEFGFDEFQEFSKDIAKISGGVSDFNLVNDKNADSSSFSCVACNDDPSQINNKKLILVTAMTPNSHGVGKTTVSIGLADAMNQIGASAILSLREPSMGPVFGVKGGGTGGGQSVLEPSQVIDLHFTGDFHAIAQANNLLASIIDNHIFQGNDLGIDSICFKRCLDVNDRSLREISYQIRGRTYTTGFNITAASEVMSIVALSKNYSDLRARLGQILVGVDSGGKPIFACDLHAENAMTALLNDAMKPNAVLSRGGSLALVHTGAFANIAHGASSVVSIANALSHADFCVTEAGFGSDLGAEKFVNITSRVLGKDVDLAVLVVTVEGVKEHGRGNLLTGFENVKKHLSILRETFNLSVIVAINRHVDDDEKEVGYLQKLCESEDVTATVCQPFEKGGAGCVDLAKKVVSQTKKPMKRTYLLGEPVQFKIQRVAQQVYGASRVIYSDLAMQKLDLAQKLNLPYLNIAKTPLSISDDKKLINVPKNFDFHVTDLEFRCGAGMTVALSGDMLLMPGLGKRSRYLDF